MHVVVSTKNLSFISNEVVLTKPLLVAIVWSLHLRRQNKPTPKAPLLLNKFGHQDDLRLPLAITYSNVIPIHTMLAVSECSLRSVGQLSPEVTLKFPDDTKLARPLDASRAVGEVRRFDRF